MADEVRDSPAIASRRDVISASAIRILAREGVRALTHRAVDAAAGLPPGSTSRVARTREALLTLVVNTLAERTLTDSDDTAASLARLADRGNLTIDELAELLTTLVESLASRRDDMRARYALILELHNSPTLHAKLTTGSEVHRTGYAVISSALDLAGLPTSSSDVDTLIRLADSLTFYRTAVDTGAPIRPVLAAFLRGLRES
ncbi:TetR/AcrR family transcriptional regulator [Tsukamurella tyrosinosolvens]|uniref:TetR/AcrR family transcriptional regulator n=1 Tax=Tsukamurella tyrosinosolvens TaxID=57704 RepID=UPI001E5A6AB9|nr:TetR family transcriptional regulator [Tsukamurella tyrosinosolvens]